MGTTKLPEPTRLRNYLVEHGWREGWVLSTGTMFVFVEPDDNGQDITVFVPDSSAYDDYPRGIADIVDTVSAIERRSKEAVRADLLGEGATSTASANGAPSASVPDSPAQPIV